MTCSTSNKITVFCVDDNPLVTDALKLQIERAADVQWHGSAPNADGLLTEARVECSDIVLLDIDMPGKDPFDAIAELVDICRDSRVLMYSGLLKRELVDQALEAGAWGYVAKTDGERELLSAIRSVAAGSFAFSPSVRSLLTSG
ncbi:MAG: response regulator transcription factor [Phycisphaerales bacterium]|nr:response regulator transcription factor [Phycisphaerales bacterium]MCI0630655.1 response regulator transcription factor [Phycisphaerales bacterium]MCI0676688.1 response regulator transcription factor [Phycisphaerales bacterium]